MNGRKGGRRMKMEDEDTHIGMEYGVVYIEWETGGGGINASKFIRRIHRWKATFSSSRSTFGHRPNGESLPQGRRDSFLFLPFGGQ